MPYPIAKWLLAFNDLRKTDCKGRLYTKMFLDISIYGLKSRKIVFYEHCIAVLYILVIM